MKSEINYYIGECKFNTFDLVKLAMDFGWKSVDLRIETPSPLQSAIEFLSLKGIDVRRIIIEGGSNPIVPETSKTLVNINNEIMRCFAGDSEYLIDTTLLGDECWDIQIFGILGCTGCPDKNRDTCSGGVSVANGKNSLGNDIPIAKVIGLRTKRGKGREMVDEHTTNSKV